MLQIALDVLSWLFLGSGAICCVVGGIGVLRLPDFYTRTHAASIPDTLGALLIVTGLIFQSGLTLPAGGGEVLIIGLGYDLVTIKLLMMLAFILFTSPTAAHALVKAAHARGVSWEGLDTTSDREESDGLPG